VREGDTLRVKLTNKLPQDTTIHWHGLTLDNKMDGVPDLTQSPVARNQTFTYEFTAPFSGTYYYSSFVGTQADRFLYGPLIIDPANEQRNFDYEFIIMLDDWIDGVAGSPDDALKKLQSGGITTTSAVKGESAPDLNYPLYLINGTSAETPYEMTIKNNSRLLLRFINAAASTIFHVALQGHRMQVTHADGHEIAPVEVDALRIGMGERYDTIVTANHPGVWQLAARVEGTQKTMTRALLRYQGEKAKAPPADALPAELSRQTLQYSMLKAGPGVAVMPNRQPDTVTQIQLNGDPKKYTWTINGERYPNVTPISVAKGNLIRFEIQNQSPLPQPMHLHGQLFQLDNGTGHGPLKDTVLIDPGQKLAILWTASNPGQWAFHSNNVYHRASGMLGVVKVE
jgi:FtsP/CotA-like multicopper oxidase with cupredoxin domain